MLKYVKNEIDLGLSHYCVRRLEVRIEFQQPEKRPLSVFLDAHETDSIDILQTQVCMCTYIIMFTFSSAQQYCVDMVPLIP